MAKAAAGFWREPRNRQWARSPVIDQASKASLTATEIIRIKNFPYHNKDAIVPTWQLIYFSRRVEAQIECWPVGIRASFLRVAEVMASAGPDIGLPHTRALGAGLFEIRAKGREGIGRAFFCTVTDHRMVILHTIIKKTEQTPARALETARARQREVSP
jgi:phage-related protein